MPIVATWVVSATKDEGDVSLIEQYNSTDIYAVGWASTHSSASVSNGCQVRIKSYALTGGTVKTDKRFADCAIILKVGP